MQFIKQKKLFGIRTSNKEINDLIKGWAAISIAFTILLNGLTFDIGTVLIMIVSAVTVGTGFLLHELAHKFVAQHYKCWAEFRADNTMLLIAMGSAFFGFIFAAPGAVMIYGPHITKRQNGVISAAGPLTNFILAFLFLGLMLVPVAFLQAIASYGFLINTWLGLFNMIPFMNLDGKKIFTWSKPIWVVMVAAGISLFVLKGALFVVS
jgi:Zn-dependent protease